MIKIVYIIKKWESQGILSYHANLISLLLNKGYKGFVFVQELQRTPKQLAPISYPLVKWKVIRDILKIKPNVLIIFHYFGSPFVLPILLLSRVFGIRTVIVTDFTEIGFPRIHKSPIKTFKDIVRYFLLSFQLFLVDSPVCYTEYEEKVLSKMMFPKRKFTIIPIGSNFKINTLKKENYILTVSRWWSDRKNLHTILKVFSEIKKNVGNYKLVIVGKFTSGKYFIPDENRYETGAEYKQKILNIINELNLKNCIEFVGVKTGKDLEKLFKKARIFYLPSKNETFGVVFVEAMASGTPIVAMKNSAVQYVVKDEVTGFLRNTEKGQKEAILRLLTDKELYKQIQKNCLKEAGRYKWNIIVKKWERLIIELTGEEIY